MEFLSFEKSAGRAIDAHGSVGVTARALVRGEAVAVTVLHVAAGGVIGSHPAPVNQLLMITAGNGAVRVGDGDWENIGAGQAVLWRAGEEHTTKATDDLIAVAIEMVAIPLKPE